MTSPFRESAADIRGATWLDRAARSSLLAAHSKFYGDSRESLLTVQLIGSSPAVGAYDTARVAMAIQDATAKIGHIIRDPSKETTQARRSDRDKARLVARGQSNGTIFFGFPDTRSDSPLFDFHVPSLTEEAARELCQILPASSTDDAALDAVIGQRRTVRSAIGDLVEAVTEISSGIGLLITSSASDDLKSELSTDQARVLRDSLQESRTDRRTQLLTGRLDGVRTRRRIFYLELESGEEIHGAIIPETNMMDQIRQSLDRRVVATVESVQVETVAGRRSRPSYRLLALDPAPSLFDDH